MSRSIPVVGILATLWLISGLLSAQAADRVAALTDLTSYTAEYGQQELAGLQVMAEDLAGTRLAPTVVVQDTKGLAKEGLGGLKQILSRGAKPVLLFSSLSSVSVAVLPAADRAGLLTLCNATSDSPLKISRNSIRNFPSPQQEFSLLFDGAIRPLGLRRVGLVFINDEYGKAMETLFSRRAPELGATDILTEAYGFDVSDFRPVVAKVNARQLDGVIVVGYGSQAGSLVKQLRDGGFAGRIFVPSLIVNADSVVKAAGTALNGVVFNGFDYQDDKVAANVLARFRDKYAGRQSDIGILAYVGGKIILDHAVSGQSPAQVIATLEAKQPFKTVLGEVRFVDRSFLYSLKLYEVGPDGVHPFTIQ